MTHRSLDRRRGFPGPSGPGLGHFRGSGCTYKFLGALWAVLLALSLPCCAQSDHPYKYFRVGNAADAANVTPRPGYALMGGGADLDQAFQWLCERAGGGDLLVLRATGTDAYNPYIQKLCHLNSVATLVIPDRKAAEDPFVASAIHHAAALFISGGDQANYINFWMGSPVQTALNDAVARGIPIGGTSAGLAVLGEWAYSAQGDKPRDADLSSQLAMSDPFGPRITLVHGFLRIPILAGIITDTHFAKRGRMGRLLVFLARLNEPDQKPIAPSAPRVRGIGVEQGTAVLLEPDGRATVAGQCCAWFVATRYAPGGGYALGSLSGESGVQAPHPPPAFGPFEVQKVAPGHTFNLKTWAGDATPYTLDVKAGSIHSTQPGGAVY